VSHSRALTLLPPMCIQQAGDVSSVPGLFSAERVTFHSPWAAVTLRWRDAQGHPLERHETHFGAVCQRTCEGRFAALLRPRGCGSSSRIRGPGLKDHRVVWRIAC